MSNKNGIKEGKEGPATVDEDDDNLYYKVYAAGVIFVALSLTFQGCLFYSCSAGVSNFGTSLSAGYNPSDGKFLGKFNETWECENACLATPGRICVTFTFLPFGDSKDSLDGMCYGGFSPRLDPVPIKRKSGAVTGVISGFTSLAAPVAALSSSKGHPLGKIVGTITEIKKATAEWPIFAAVAGQVQQLDDRSRSDLWGLLCIILVVWPFLHQLAIDRHDYLNPQEVAVVENARSAKTKERGELSTGFQKNKAGAVNAIKRAESKKNIKENAKAKNEAENPLGIELPDLGNLFNWGGGT